MFRRAAGAYLTLSGKYPSYRSAGRADPLPRHWRLRKLVRADKQAFLIRELNSKRPLLPRNWEPSDDTREVLNTCKAIVDARRICGRLRDLHGEDPVRRTGVHLC
ncbi:phosphoenolpyruvate carboxylase [Enterobacter hormaechei]